jgi:hypothetical protein
MSYFLYFHFQNKNEGVECYVVLNRIDKRRSGGATTKSISAHGLGTHLKNKSCSVSFAKGKPIQQKLVTFPY